VKKTGEKTEKKPRKNREKTEKKSKTEPCQKTAFWQNPVSMSYPGNLHFGKTSFPKTTFFRNCILAKPCVFWGDIETVFCQNAVFFLGLVYKTFVYSLVKKRCQLFCF
jgi:hypothetical protein